MQALSIYPSASESWKCSVMSQLDMELCSFSSSSSSSSYSCSFNWRQRGRRLYVSTNLRGFGDGFSFVGRNCELKLCNGSVGFSENENDSEVTPVEVKDEAIHENSSDGSDGDKREKHMSNSGRVNVRALAMRLQSGKTVDDVDEVLKEEKEHPLQVYSSIIRGFGKDKRIEAAMALFEWLKRKSKEDDSTIQLNYYIYNCLLGAMKLAEDYGLVEDVMNGMALEGVSPNVVTFNTLMGIYVEQGREMEALRLFEEMQMKGVTPSPASYSTVLFAYQRLGDAFGALMFFVEVRKKYKDGEIRKGVDEDWDWDHELVKLEDFISRICYQVMRRWLVKKENLSKEVMRLLGEMDKNGLSPSFAEHEKLIWACTREEHCIVAKELYMRIREMGSEISLSVCNHVIWLMGKGKKWWAALEIYENLLDKGPKPNSMSYELIVSHFNILLSAARKKGIWRWGLRLLNRMEEKGLKPGSREWNAVLVACSKSSETSAAIEIFKRMVEQGEKPTIVSYEALLSALQKGKLYDEGVRVWNHMIKVGIKPSLYAYTIMASIYAGQGNFDLLDSIIKEMVTVGIQPTVVTFNAIISSCSRNDLGRFAYEWFQRMNAENVVPDNVTYNVLIEALANDGKPRLAYELHLRACNEGMVLSSKAYDAVVRASEIHGTHVDITSLGPQPLEAKKKVRIRKNLPEFSNLADVPRRIKPFDREDIMMSSTEELHR